MNLIIKKIISNKTALFVLCLLLIILPSVIVSVCLSRYINLENEAAKSELLEKTRILTSELKRFNSVEAFIAKNILSGGDLRLHPGVSEFIGFCKELKSVWKDEFQAALSGSGNNIIFKTENLKLENRIIEKVFSIVYGSDCSTEDLILLKQVFGNQITGTICNHDFKKSNYKFIDADNSGEKAPFIFDNVGNGNIIIWISRPLLNSRKHIDFICKKFANINKINVGIYNSKEIISSIRLCNSSELDNDVKNKLCLEKNGDNVFSTSRHWVCKQYLGQDMFVFLYMEKKYTNIVLFAILFGVSVFYIFLSASILRYSYNKIVLGISRKVSIKAKLAAIILFATSVSLLLLFFVCKEYEIHKKHCLMLEAKEYSADKLMETDTRYKAFLDKMSQEVNDIIDSWAKDIKGRRFCIDDVKKLNSELKGLSIDNYYCIASQSSCWIENTGCYEYTGPLDNISIRDDASEILDKNDVSDFKQFKFINLVAKRVCADINEIGLPLQIMQKLDLIADTVAKEGFVEIVYSVLNNLDRIKPWGYSNKNSNALFKLIKLNDPIQSDYLFSLFWHDSDLRNRFLKEFLPMANRNSKNFKYLDYDIGGIANSQELSKNQLYQAAIKASINKDELDVVMIDKELYLLSAYESPVLKDTVFLGLYPVSEIEAKLKNTMTILWVLLSLSIILVLFAISLVCDYFLTPIKVLEKKALSIENKEYDLLSGTASNDEFALLSKTFNNAMESMKELELAQLVQEGMFPDSKFEQKEFAVFGKNQVMTVVGGDYFDIFPVKDNSFVALMGDVAGHGVGASVLMAMAKSAIIAGKDKYESPAAMLNYLHKMVLATKTEKQRKIMTFQYLYLNSVDGNGIYGNAGGCSPCIVRDMGKTVEELKMSGAVLGAFKKANYKEMPIELENGDALIFYSDGIVEAKNTRDEMIGYDALFEIFKEAYHADPEKYYENIYARYLEHIKGLEPQDDMTIVIITRRSKKAKLWENVNLLDLA